MMYDLYGIKYVRWHSDSLDKTTGTRLSSQHQVFMDFIKSRNLFMIQGILWNRVHYTDSLYKELWNKSDVENLHIQ